MAGALLVGLAVAIYRPAWHLPEEPEPEMSLPTDRQFDDRVLTFCSDPWMPYAGEAGGPKEGYVVDLLRAIFSPNGFEVRYQTYPWSRCIEETRQGHVLGIICAERQETPDFTFPQESVGVNRPTFFTRPGSDWEFAGIPSLERVRLGAIQDYFYADDLEEYIRLHRESERVVLAKGTHALEHLFALLADGSIEVLVENAMVVQYHQAMATTPIPLREAGSLAGGGRLFVAFSPRDPRARDMARRFDEGMRALRATGRLSQILKEAGVSDWQEAAGQTTSPSTTGPLPPGSAPDHRSEGPPAVSPAPSVSPSDTMPGIPTAPPPGQPPGVLRVPVAPAMAVPPGGGPAQAASPPSPATPPPSFPPLTPDPRPVMPHPASPDAMTPSGATTCP